MSIEFENTIISEFYELDFKQFKIDLSEHHLFLCGGIVDATSENPPSFRDRLLRYTAKEENEIHSSFVLAENFKDYFKENRYTDLLAFEEDIASLSTLIIILLESPGSLVELGMFCNKPEFYKKLLIVAPQEHIQEEESFIYLGPLEYIRKKDCSSVVIYPWPSFTDKNYDESNITDLCAQIKEKLGLSNDVETFDPGKPGHIGILIYEIIRICHPVLIGEIELALEALSISTTISAIERYIYLLSKLNLVNHLFYSNYKYYYPTNSHDSKIRLGRLKNRNVSDIRKIQFSIRQSFVLKRDDQSRKRSNALKQITKKLDGVA